MANYAFSGGSAQVPGYGQKVKIRFVGSWSDGDSYTLLFTSTEGDFTIGSGNLVASVYKYMLTYGGRVYIANGSKWNFSAPGNPTGWEEQDVGAGFILFGDNYGPTDLAVALAVIQGRVAVFGQNNIQIWTVDADPNNFTRVQVLANSGTNAPGSVQSIGELDIFYLDRTGVRSLRSKESTLNAYVADVGISIDAILQEALANAEDAVFEGVCSIVEPANKRYWLYIDGLIYVLSQFPASKITAWNTYNPTYQATNVNQLTNNDSLERVFRLGTGPDVGEAEQEISVSAGTSVDDYLLPAKYIWSRLFNSEDFSSATEIPNGMKFSGTIVFDGINYTFTNNQEAFVPKKFIIYNGLVYCRGTVDGADYVFVYGGIDGQTYDTTCAVARLPWLDDKQPATIKAGMGINMALAGSWSIFTGMDPKSGVMKRALFVTGGQGEPEDSTYDIGVVPFSDQGTHFALEAYSSVMVSLPARLGAFIFHYNQGNIVA